jgi:GH15 family glucan-1,4-alpha-glucosidase
VRIGNAAWNQLQLDVYGELGDMLHLCRRKGLPESDASWQFEKAVLRSLDEEWTKPDEGIWEVRGPRRHFTHSKVMAWVAFDRAIKAVENFGRDGPVDHWQEVRKQIHRDVLEHGYNERLGSFVQSYGSDRLDASLLMIPLVGFLPADDPRMLATIEAISDRLTDEHGLVYRYRTADGVDGLAGAEGTFLLCTFWLAQAWALAGELDRARAVFARAAGYVNDVGLLAEEVDPATGDLLGNFPQAFSHIGLVNAAWAIQQAGQRRDAAAAKEGAT